MTALTVLFAATPVSAASFGHIPNVPALLRGMGTYERGGSWAILSFGRLGGGYRASVSSASTSSGYRGGNRLAREGVFGRIPSSMGI